jgi:UDP-2,4-diacetamido-2,4,6-trideoxy-beta-L-altropyranose hydrolase
MADARGINAIASAAIVVDGYGFGPDYLAEASRGGIPVVAIDDHATGPVPGASLVVNQNIWAPPADPDRGFLFGLDHALLGPAFVRAVRPPEPVAGRVLVTMGGADPDRLGPVIAEALVGVEGVSSVDLVVGAATPHLDRCLDLAAREPRVRVGHDLPHLAGVMGQARLAIVAAGGTLWEGLMAGAPMIAVDRDAVQAASVEIMLARGVLLGRLRADDVTPDRLATLVRDCLGRPDDLDRVSRSGRATVDGRGAERVARAILAAVGRDRT